MFFRTVNVQHLQIITRCVRSKGRQTFYEALCCSRVPLMLNKAIHTSSVDYRHIFYKKYVPPPYEDHDHKNMRLKRPMSPHVLDYGPTVPAMTSIGQRITGTILTFYAVMLASGSLFLSNGIDTYVSMIQSLNLSWMTCFIFKIIIGYPFCFHYFIGLRFIGFNMLKFLDLKTAYITAYQAIAASAFLAVVWALR